MDGALKAICTAILAIALGIPPQTQAQSDRADPAFLESPAIVDAFRVLDAWITSKMEQDLHPGLSIGIIYDQKLIWAKGYGYADVENQVPATPSTVYRIGSITKLFTASVIMQLRDAGKLRLDDPVVEYIPWFGDFDGISDIREITIRQLLTHTSGLPRDLPGLDDRNYFYPSREDLIQQWPQQQAVFAPATEWKYSNLGVSLVGEIIARSSGETWEENLDKHILRPLEMRDSTVRPTQDTAGLAVGYSRAGPPQSYTAEPVVDLNASRPAGNIASSVEDLAKFVSLQFRNESAGRRDVLKPSTVQEMHRVHWLHPDWNAGWGLGFWIERRGQVTRVGHGGRMPGFSASLDMDLEQKLGVIFLSNISYGNPEAYRDQAFKIVAPVLATAVAQNRRDAGADRVWEHYSGAYTNTISAEKVDLMAIDGRLTMRFADDSSPMRGRIVLDPVGENRFKALMVNPVFHPATLHGEIFVFEFDANGYVTGFGNHYAYWERDHQDESNGTK